MRFQSHQSWFPKEIDLPNDYEDASARSERKGRAVIADGVSSAIFSRAWARLLTRTAVGSPPPVADDAALMAWVGDLQKLWREGINFKALPWNLKPKAASTGAQATLLLLDLEPLAAGDAVSPGLRGEQPESSGSGGPATDPRAEYRMQVHALGDCSLFVVRDGEMIRSFPLVDSAAFAAPPQVFSSIAKGVAYAERFQHLDDRCREGDLLVLCTDAIGLWAMQEYEAGRQVDWMRYWGDDAAWQADIRHFRALPAGDPQRMRIDDCTLLLLRVVAETTDESEPDTQPDRSDEPFVLHGADQPAENAEAAAPQNVAETVDPKNELAGVATAHAAQDGEAEDPVAEDTVTAAGDPPHQADSDGPANTTCDSSGQPRVDRPSPPVADEMASTLPATRAEAAEPPPVEPDEEKIPGDARPKNWWPKLFSD
jgi:hypothetical protein